MHQQLNSLVVVIIYLLMLPAVTFAQLPTPTYGWNLGNTLEPPCGEGCWGPAATQALIDAVVDAGFNTIRIPCAWDSNANQSTYVIDSTYMARVKEVVDWCYARNLYIIINCHWDGGWLEWYITDTVDSTINAKQNAYWTQIANTFINYDDHLLFAGCNEPGADTAAEMATLLTYEQTFIDAVRATGGNNTNRWLLVQGPNTDIDTTYNLMNTLPADTTSDRLMVEIHYYSPWQFCGLTEDAGWGNMFYFWGQDYHSDTMTSRNATWGEEDYLESQFQKMKTKFIDEGTPVLLGEFSATRRTGYPDLTGADLDLHLASRVHFHETVVDVANSKDLKPCFWDAGSSGTNGTWLFDRSTAVVVDADNITALTGGDNDTTSPAAPTGLTASLDVASVALNWNDNAEGDLKGYNVYRSVTSGSGYMKLNSSPVLDSEYTDTPPGGETYYVVTAVDTFLNESDDSNEVSVTTPFTAMGTILYELWTDIYGTAVSDLTSNANYPDNPSSTDQLTSLEGPTDFADYYGTRIRGYLYPPATGDYTFWIASDDNSELWLSTDGTPANATLIAKVINWTNSREWDKETETEQESASITLTTGQKYYIEVLQKEHGGGDNIAVAWSGPGISQEVIGGQYLSPWLTGLYGDFNNNGSVSVEDLAMFAERWVSNNCVLTSAIDLDGNCIADLYEFSQFAQNWMN